MPAYGAVRDRPVRFALIAGDAGDSWALMTAIHCVSDGQSWIALENALRSLLERRRGPARPPDAAAESGGNRREPAAASWHHAQRGPSRAGELGDP
ncbi:hypothetical protein [Streptomyces olivaceoviridis]|uniref:hypothetical protein n=1 Tax=Streptomyces olivaceoviridis TaxID=1921 RepID=UPI00332DCEA0